MIVVIDYGMGNIRSIGKALERLQIEFILTKNPEDLEKATHIILPGVGFFKKGMENLHNSGFIKELKKQVLINKKPILGICLGMQLLFERSEEGSNEEGLVNGIGFIKGDVKKFDFSQNTEKLKIPHMGWNQIFNSNFNQIKILNNIPEKSNFYFIHSYHAVLNNNVNNEVLYALTDYGYDFVSVVQKDNIFGTQFHPEKSQTKGLQILKNFVNI